MDLEVYVKERRLRHVYCVELFLQLDFGVGNELVFRAVLSLSNVVGLEVRVRSRTHVSCVKLICILYQSWIPR